jgi:hypothetical protein
VSARASIICGKGTANVAESREGGRRRGDAGGGVWHAGPACRAGARTGSCGSRRRIMRERDTPTPPGPDRTWTAPHACGVGAAVCPHDDMWSQVNTNMYIDSSCIYHAY